MSIETNSLLKKGHGTGTTRSMRSIALAEKELEIVRAEMAKTDFKLTGKQKFYSWVVLITLLLA